MDKEMKKLVKKTVKIAGVTCFALGGAALIASGAALKAIAEGGKYLKDTVKKILEEDTVEAVSAEEVVAEEVAVEEEVEESPAAEAEAVEEEVPTVEVPAEETV